MKIGGTDETLWIPFTIEAQLEQYSKRNERYELLWHAWKQNKRWLIKLLELTFPSFPGYSQHDSSHAETVLHNIERVLGEHRIRSLSASDCFMLLHTAYIHDIGMCITADDRSEIIHQDDFVSMIDRYSKSGDINLREWADTLRKTQYDEIPEERSVERKARMKALFQEKLNVYYAVIHTLAEYRRQDHGDHSREQLEQLVDSPEKLGGGFSMSGIPMRIFLSIAACGGLHATWGFSSILELPKEDSGYALDKIHPRFVAVMLQLGDALDLDNDRFHPLMLEYVGSLSNTSQNHYNKHKAIRCLQITPSEIFIEANCPDQSALHLVREACDGIEDLLKEASYHWAEIVPDELHGCLPTLLPPKLRINNRSIPKELVSCRFNISQEKAFSLLEGSNLYANSFAFLRELLQNAIDATKFQCWHDYQRSSARYREEDNGYIHQVKVLRPERYPIEISLSVAAESRFEQHFFSEQEMERAGVSKEDCIYGVLVEVRDFGTGITREALRDISKVGTSHNLMENLLLEMPPLLRPTGKFGIGLQSVFVVNNKFSCQTHARSQDAYQVTFNSVNSVTGHEGGYINVEPLDPEESVLYGTNFQVFVPCSQKHDYRDSLSAWLGKDPFDPDIQKNGSLLQAEDLQSQMLQYLNELPGDKLYPICVYLKNGFSRNPGYNWRASRNKMDHVLLVDENDKKQHPTFKHLLSNICWALWDYDWNWAETDDKYRFRGKLSDGDRYWFDMEACKLHIWSESCQAFACFGADRFLSTPVIQEAAQSQKVSQREPGVHLFFKGVRLRVTDVLENDMELLEYVDLKDGSTGDLLELNRDALTESGRVFLREKVYPKIMASAQEALCSIAKKNAETDGAFVTALNARFFGESPSDLAAHERDRETMNLVSFILLAYFAKIAAWGRTVLPSCAQNNGELQKELTNLQKTCMWEQLLTECAKQLEADFTVHKNGDGRWSPKLLRVRFFEDQDSSNRDLDRSLISIAAVLTSKMRYAAVSMRESPRHEWKHSLCQVAPKDISNSLAYYKMLAEVLSRKQKEVLYERYTDYFVRWMLHNIPSSECYTYLSDPQDPGNIRVNLLTSRFVEEVYFNHDLRYLLIRKAVRKHTALHASRFSTIVWKEFSCLRIEQLRDEVCPVNCGFVALSCRPTMLLPISGSEITQIYCFGDNLRKEDGHGVMEQFALCKKIIDAIRPYRYLLHEELMEAVDYCGKQMEGKPLTTKYFCKLRLKEASGKWLHRLVENDEMNGTHEATALLLSDLMGAFEKLAEAKLDNIWEEFSQDSAPQETDGLDFSKACVLAMICMEHNEEILRDAFFSDAQKEALIDELWQANTSLTSSKTASSQQALINEVFENGVHHPSVDLTYRLYRQLIGQMIDSVRIAKIRFLFGEIDQQELT